MAEEFTRRAAAEEQQRRAAYEADVAAAKLATVHQLVSGEVVIKPPSPGRSRSPGAWRAARARAALSHACAHARAGAPMS